MNDGIVITDRWTKGNDRVGKRWRARVWDPHHRAYASKSFSDRTEADRWCRERSIRLKAGQETALAAHFKHWGGVYVERLQLRNRSARHIRQVEVVIERLVAAGVDDMRDTIFESMVERAIARMTSCRKGGVMERREAGSKPLAIKATAKPASAAAKNFAVIIAKAVCRLAHNRRAIPYHPLASLDPFPKTTELRRVFSVPELKRLVATVAMDDAWFLYACLLAYTGARSSEAIGMRWDMVRWDTGLIELPAAIAGNKLKCARLIPLQPELLGLLRPRAKLGKVPIVGERIATLPTSSVSRGFQDYCRRVGVEHQGRGPHCLRHTFAALMTAMDVNTFYVMSIMGHREPRTAKHYASRALELRASVQHWPRGQFHLLKDPAKSKHVIAPSSVSDQVVSPEGATFSVQVMSS